MGANTGQILVQGDRRMMTMMLLPTQELLELIPNRTRIVEFGSFNYCNCLKDYNFHDEVRQSFFRIVRLERSFYFPPLGPPPVRNNSKELRFVRPSGFPKQSRGMDEQENSNQSRTITRPPLVIRHGTLGRLANILKNPAIYFRTRKQ